jgi:hypothetical protein
LHQPKGLQPLFACACFLLQRTQQLVLLSIT